MSSIIAFSVDPGIINSGDSIELNSLTIKTGQVTYTAPSGVTFGNGSSSLDHDVNVGGNQKKTKLSGPSSQQPFKLRAQFKGESDFKEDIVEIN